MARAAETVFVTAPRQVIPGRILFLTRRVQQGQFLLVPKADVKALFDYCLAVAAEKFGIVTFAWLAMSNHYHLVVGDTRGNIPEFLAWFNRMIGRLLNRKWGRHQNFWSAEQPSVIWCVTPQDAFDKLIYSLANAAAADLVARTAEWPGSSSFLQNIGGLSDVIERPAAFFSKRSKLPKVIELRAARLPGFGHLSDATYHRKVADAVRHQEKRASERRLREGGSVLGRSRVLAQSHLDFPKQPLSRGALHPHVACRDKKRRICMLERLEAFRTAHFDARERFCLGDREVVFPAGTYRIQSYGAICAPYTLDEYDEVA